MDYKNLLITLGFNPKENTVGVFFKKYPQADNYCLEVNLEKQTINYGDKIRSDSKTTQNFSQDENWVVLECVNRLLEKGYKPENIVLEKNYPAGRGVTKRLDILLLKDEQPYLMIECKTYGEEFDRELKNTQKNGGQLFTYFQQDTKAELLMLYTSDLIGNKIVPNCKIIKIEEAFRSAGSVKNVFKLWNKKFHEQGFWENPPYDFKDEIFTKSQLWELTEDKGKKLFHGFATILRKHSVSDKPNAFNVIFNLFLAKLYDEQSGEDDELKFQWRKDDDPVDFQIRLHNLHKEGLNDFLKKEIEGIKEEDFDAKLTPEQRYIAKKKFLKFNKFFSIKDVFDDETFEQNHRVLKEVVQLIEKYQIRYPRKQKYLSEFFELLLTTGLKQEVGQYFTPPPIAKFIVKSLPIPAMIERGIDNPTPKLPAAIDYAAGSGHFITEIMEEYQDIIDNLDTSKYSFPNAKTKAKVWAQESGEPYSWASSYIYGIEKDYRLVKVAKVGCYFYGDGVAQVIHGDGLDSLTSPPKSYIGLLEQNTNTEDSTKNKFSIVVANPPYSVKYCKEDLEYTGSQKDFTLYPYLTDNSNEIECLFVERTKQLLKDGGVAGIILPSSILSNEGIYTKTREIILQYFEIIAITELGSNTFMATGTNTIALFLRRRNNNDSIKLREFVERFFVDFQDNNPPNPFNIIEKPVAKYVSHVWQSVHLADYVSLIKNTANENIQNHEFYKTYCKSVEQKITGEIAKAQKNRKTQLSEDDAQKIKDRIEKEYFHNFIETEKEKLLYFILAFNQNVVLINTGKGDDEKRFLGYEFRNRKGHEGIHPIKGKSIDECTKLYSEKDFTDETKASTYIYKAFSGDYDFPIHENLKNNISRVRLADMLTFDRAGFVKNISTAVKKKVRIESKWKLKALGEIEQLEFINGYAFKSADFKHQITSEKDLPVLKIANITNNSTDFTNAEYHDTFGFNSKIVNQNDIAIALTGATVGKAGWVAEMCLLNQRVIAIKNSNITKFVSLFIFEDNFYDYAQNIAHGNAQGNLSPDEVKAFKIPIPPKEIQQKIVDEIENLEKKESETREKIESLKRSINDILEKKSKEQYKIDSILTLEYGATLPESNRINGEFPVMGSNGIVGYHNEYLIESPSIIVGRKGSAGKITWIDKNCYPIDTTFYVKLINNQFHLKLIYYALRKLNLDSLSGGTGVPGLNRNDAYSKIIFLPPLSEQQQIVSEIEKIETQIAEMEQQLSEIPKQKEAVLKEYL